MHTDNALFRALFLAAALFGVTACAEDVNLRPVPTDDDDVTDAPPSQEVCDDGIDNDLDGAVDCDDQSCAGIVPCYAPEAGHCNDGIDNDIDGAMDCDDQDCAANDPICWERSEVMVQSQTAHAQATQANAFIQVECIDPEADCHDTTVIWQEVEIRGSDGIAFEPYLDLTAPELDLAADLWWSMEVAPIGCDDRFEDCAEFYPPVHEEFGFDQRPGIGLAFQVPEGMYGSPISCDIQESCDSRTVTGGVEYRWNSTVCQPPSGAPLHVRVGFDWLACRGTTCPDGNDDWLAANQSQWALLNPGSCLEIYTP